MAQEKGKLHPIGTVVELEGIDKIVMITGYFRSTEDGKIYDYSAVGYPVGNAGYKSFILFDADLIKKVVYTGYQDSDFDYYTTHIDVFESVMKKALMQTKIKSAILE